MTDAMKLIFARSLLPPSETECLMLLVFSDPRAAAHFQRTSWMAGALRAAGIGVMVVELPEDIRARVQEAQELQFR